MALHMAGDLIASIGAPPKTPTLVTHDVIMLAFGSAAPQQQSHRRQRVLTTQPEAHQNRSALSSVRSPARIWAQGTPW